MDYMQSVKDKVRSTKANKIIVLPEAFDERMVIAANKIQKENLAKVILLGTEDVIKPLADKNDIDYKSLNVVDHLKSSNFDSYADEYFKLREKKGMTKDEAKKVMENPLYYSVMMVRKGEVDGCVAGANNTTGEVIRASLHIVGTKKGIKTLSSCFIMELADNEIVDDKLIIFSDCAVVPDPNVEQLSDIAISAAESCQSFLGKDPKVAMLSFSTKGSAQHDDAQKVIDAAKLANEKAPHFDIDGEIQFDAALLPSIGKKKAPNSKVAGNANVFVFPDLGAGNIGYKILERLGKAKAIGPVFQGLAMPINDLSRGCSADDIVNTVTFTLLQS